MTDDKKREEEGFSSPYDALGAELLEELLTRPAFSYDAARDPHYLALREGARADASRALADTVGRVSAATGGYGSSYAATAGARAFDEVASGAEDLVPELYALARERYESEGEALTEKLRIANDLSDRDYKRYRDEVEDKKEAEQEAARAEREEAERNEELKKDEQWPSGIEPEDVTVADGVWQGVSPEEATAVMLKAGVDEDKVASLLTPAAWSRGRLIFRRDGKGDAATFGYDSYEAYLSAFVTEALGDV